MPAVAKFFPEVEPFLQRYRPLAVKAGVDPLGFYMPPFAYASCQVLPRQSPRSGSTRPSSPNTSMPATFKTMVGDIKFGADGEWATARCCSAQFQSVSGNAHSSSSWTRRVKSCSARRGTRPARWSAPFGAA